jgi:small ligand-binding sensory domain FIST
VLLGGQESLDLERLGDAFSTVTRGVPVLVVPGSGVATDRTEFEHEPALVALAWSGGRSTVIVSSGPESKQASRKLAFELEPPGAPSRTGSAMVFTRAEGTSPECVEPLARLGMASRIFGGTVATERVLGLDAEGRWATGIAAALSIDGLGCPVVDSAPALRPLAPPARVTACRGPLVLEIDDGPALEALGEAGAGLPDQPLIVAVLYGDQSLPQQSPLVRAIQGIDPARGGVVLSAPVSNGTWLGFAARDAAASRARLEHMLRDVEQRACGAAPRFSVFLKSSGRGQGLYGTADVDIRLIRSRFGDLPVVGISTVAEIVPVDGALSLQLLSGTVALYTMPS